MNEEMEQIRSEGDVFDAALRDQVRADLSDPSAEFHARVMEHVRAQQPLPHFRLPWLDALVSLLFASLVGMAFLIFYILPPEVSALLQIEVLYWVARLRQYPWPAISLAASIGLALIGLALVGFGVGRWRTKTLRQ